MRGLPYYEEDEYHTYLLSAERRELFPIEKIMSQINLESVDELLDFGIGNGYFLNAFFKQKKKECNIWGAECQEAHIDTLLQLKVKEELENFIPFYLERTEHPLLPNWIPQMDLIFCSCVLSIFADPALAIKGIGRTLSENGKMIILDWMRNEAPSGPELGQKISLDRMRFFIDDAGFVVSRNLKLNQYVFGLEIVRDPNKPEEEFITPADLE